MARKKKKGNSKIYKNILLVLLVIVLLSAAATIGAVIKIVSDAPEIDVNILDNLKQSVEFYDKDGNPIANLHTGENRKIVSLKQIPKHLQYAYVSIEDERFFKHHGIDIKRIFGAMFANIKSRSKAQGGSTITQQLVRNYALTQEKSYVRKIQEMYLAVQLERKLSKDQILEAYLNTIYLGPNVYGVQQASRYYFDKDVEDITIAEAAFIAAITQNPGIYNPYSKKNKENPDNYLGRQRIVLKKMYENGYISEQEYQKALSEDLVAALNKPKTRLSNNYMKYHWFIEAAIDEIAKDLSDKFKLDEKDARQKLISGGYKVYLTMDARLQEKAQEILNDERFYKGIPVKIDQTKLKENESPKPNPQAAAVVMDINGEVRAIIGGRGNLGAGAFNYATDGIRHPGSSIKPLAVYAPAIEKQVITASTVINDSDSDEEANEIKNKYRGWFPDNYDRRFRGPVTVRYGLQESLNTIAAKILNRVGLDTSYNYLINKFDLANIDKKDKYMPAALALGQTLASPIEMASAYTAFANNGIISHPIFYTKVEDRTGSIVLEKKPIQKRAISEETAFIMNQLMQNVVKAGTAQAANLGAMPAGGKTGTTSNNEDGWFVGFTPYYTCAIWIGKSGPEVKYISVKSKFATPIWKAIMLEAHRGLPIKQFIKPEGVVAATICSHSRKLATDTCPSKYVEYFISGTEPIETCDVHSAPVVPVPDENTTQEGNEGNTNNSDVNNTTGNNQTTEDPNNTQNTQQNNSNSQTTSGQQNNSTQSQNKNPSNR
ncbi:transglycosylase domain-containing protein [Thermobrachium celere]|uniref:Penicillin-binding protein 1A n=2 Tax=Thermobrachium TaxID=150333 RepID=R7RSX8_9CLOT|nr:PBP1A family penicillin-binding protein [Thermobrachium celere]CDF58360.1 Multimodular transpeptidase-transglycosylase [Thermobrachium celere DSM 8682]